MQDVPPAELPPDPPRAEAPAAKPEQVDTQPPIKERADGTIVVDLKRLAAKAPQDEECLERDPNPLDEGIVVCRETTTDQKLTSNYGPADDPDEFGSAVPRAKFRLSDDATGELNATNPAVGGFNAQGVEAKVRIDF